MERPSTVDAAKQVRFTPLTATETRVANVITNNKNSLKAQLKSSKPPTASEVKLAKDDLASLKTLFTDYIYAVKDDKNAFHWAENETDDQRLLLFLGLASRIGQIKYNLPKANPKTGFVPQYETYGWPENPANPRFDAWLIFIQKATAIFKARNPALNTDDWTGSALNASVHSEAAEADAAPAKTINVSIEIPESLIIEPEATHYINAEDYDASDDEIEAEQTPTALMQPLHVAPVPSSSSIIAAETLATESSAVDTATDDKKEEEVVVVSKPANQPSTVPVPPVHVAQASSTEINAGAEAPVFKSEAKDTAHDDETKEEATTPYDAEVTKLRALQMHPQNVSHTEIYKRLDTLMLKVDILKINGDLTTDKATAILANTYLRLTDSTQHDQYQTMAKNLQDGPSTGLKILGGLMFALGVAVLALGIVFAPVLLSLAATTFALTETATLAVTVGAVGVASSAFTVPGITLFAKGFQTGVSKAASKLDENLVRENVQYTLPAA